MTKRLQKVREALEIGFEDAHPFGRADKVRDGIAALSAHEEEVRELVEALERFKDPHVTMHGALVVSEKDVKHANAILAKFQGEKE